LTTILRNPLENHSLLNNVWIPFSMINIFMMLHNQLLVNLILTWNSQLMKKMFMLYPYFSRIFAEVLNWVTYSEKENYLILLLSIYNHWKNLKMSLPNNKCKLLMILWNKQLKKLWLISWPISISNKYLEKHYSWMKLILMSIWLIMMMDK